jgi:hypothetical protein
MERKPSPWTTGLAIASLLAVLLVGYGAVYWLRLPYVSDYAFDGHRMVQLEWSWSSETLAFTPAVWIHNRVDPLSLLTRVSGDLGRETWEKVYPKGL